MKTPQLISFSVVMHEGQSMFVLPDRSLAEDWCIVEGPEGFLSDRVPVSRLSSHDSRGREVDAAVVVLRDGEPFAFGCLSWLFGQDSGYRIVSGFNRIRHTDTHRLMAMDFAVGDIVTVLCVPKG